jgi:hypothetical protein
MAEESANRISLKIDLVAGTIELTAPPAEFPDAIERTKDLASSLSLGSIPPRRPVAMAPEASEASSTGSASASAAKPAKKATRTAGGSSGRPGRIGSFEPVNLGFSEAQERALLSFAQEKKPSTQAEQVAVAMYQGEKLLDRRHYNYNEIYTLMRGAGIRDLPKALDVLLSQMIENQWVAREEAGFTLKFLARDYVEQKLPKSEAGAD